MIAVCGAASPDDQTLALADAVGYEIAKAGGILVCGGLGGVMESACSGAKRGGGLTIGIVPGPHISAANPFVDVPIASGMADGRNAIITHTAEAVIALRGSYGTLSEVALALKMGKPVCTVGDWCPIDHVTAYQTPQDAVAGTLALLRARSRGRG
ncbi:MAG: TIGR00725 family protein [candidate division Zixibacteria bacterium]|nr:TIGR00725 family protein [candidate division Zixibacteria bacterium]